MKIIYRQKSSSQKNSFLSEKGIENCYLKHIVSRADSEKITHSEHSHNGFEVHIVVCGTQKYYIDGKPCVIKSNNFLIIAPGVPHRVEKSEANIKKYSLTFSLSGYESKISFEKYLYKPAPASVIDCCLAAYEEFSQRREFSKTIIENRTVEIVALLLRAMGFSEKETFEESSDENVRVEMAKSYIKDNITSGIGIPEVARYCYVSSRQLTRLFLKYEGKTPGAYIREKKIKRIEELISRGSASFKEIAETMNFNNEYYLNAFFKKYYGMPPGEYRKMQNGENNPD